MVAGVKRSARGSKRVRMESSPRSIDEGAEVYREGNESDDDDSSDGRDSDHDDMDLTSMKVEEALEYIRENYANPESSICYSSISGLRRIFPSLTTEQIQNVLTKFESWSLMKSSKNLKKYNPFLSQHIRDVWQMDTVNLSEFSKQNAGVCHLLCCIDVFSKMLWVRPLFTCSGKEVKEALHSIMSSVEVLPETIVSDR